MAITSIHAIESTPSLALDYVRKDKVEEYQEKRKVRKDNRHYLFKERGKQYIGYYPK